MSHPNVLNDTNHLQMMPLRNQDTNCASHQSTLLTGPATEHQKRGFNIFYKEQEKKKKAHLIFDCKEILEDKLQKKRIFNPFHNTVKRKITILENVILVFTS